MPLKTDPTHPPEAPNEEELVQARALLATRPLCGCISRLLRQPFDVALVRHWTLYHSDVLVVLQEVQAKRVPTSDG